MIYGTKRSTNIDAYMYHMSLFFVLRKLGLMLQLNASVEWHYATRDHLKPNAASLTIEDKTNG